MERCIRSSKTAFKPSPCVVRCIKKSQIFKKAECFDVNVVVKGTVIPVNRATLMASSRFFREMFHRSNSHTITLAGISLPAFILALRYMYDDIGDLNDEKPAVVLEFLEQSHRFELQDVDRTLNASLYLEGILHISQALRIFKIAKLLEMTELEGKVLSFIDIDAETIYYSDEFLKLSDEHVALIVNRKTKIIPEVDAFQAVQRWISSNNKFHDPAKILQCIDLQLVTVSQMLNIVQPSKMYTDSEILKALHPGNPPVGIKTAYFQVRKESGIESFKAFNEQNMIWIEFDARYTINHINMKIAKGFQQGYNIFTSDDNEKWAKVVEYYKYMCIEDQDLYFPATLVKSVRIFTPKPIKIYEFQAYYVDKVPYLSRGLICPCTGQNGISVFVNIDGNIVQYEQGNQDNFNDCGLKTPFISATLGSTIEIIYKQPYRCNKFHMRLWDYDNRKQSFSINIGNRKKGFVQARKGWCIMKFKPIEVQSIILENLETSVGTDFRIACFASFYEDPQVHANI